MFIFNNVVKSLRNDTYTKPVSYVCVCLYVCVCVYIYIYIYIYIHIYIYTHTHTYILWIVGTLHRRNGFYTVQTVFSIALHQPYT